MAKIHKISGYLVDYDGVYSNENIREYLFSFMDVITQHFHVETADIPEYHDDDPLSLPNCDLAYCEEPFNSKYPIETNRLVEIGATYRHFKAGKLVKVLSIAQDTENVGSFSVVYECPDGGVWARPYGMFISEVDHAKYPDAKQKYRFEKVNA